MPGPVECPTAHATIRRQAAGRQREGLPGGEAQRWLARRRGLTLVYLMIVMAIIATLTAIALPIYGDLTERARISRAIMDIKVMESEIAVYEQLTGSLPASLAQINRASFADPWGNPYEYLNFAAAGPSAQGLARKDRFLVPLNSTYDLYSKGRDGLSQAPLTAHQSPDDIVRANDGGYVGLASSY
jgi:general secretion pathway protein G